MNLFFIDLTESTILKFPCCLQLAANIPQTEDHDFNKKIIGENIKKVSNLPEKHVKWFNFTIIQVTLICTKNNIFFRWESLTTVCDLKRNSQ